MSTIKTAVTKQEVLAAVERDSVHRTKEHVHGQGFTGRVVPRLVPLSKADVADTIARSRGWDGKQGLYESRASVLRHWVSMGDVQRGLDALLEEGKIYAISGSHWAVANSRGVMRNATYFVSQHAREIACEDAAMKARAANSANAAKWATKRLIDLHEEEHRSLRTQYVFEHPVDSEDGFSERF